MDYSETPENDDFRDHKFDCFLEKKGYRKGEGGQHLPLKGKSIENILQFVQLLTTHTCSLTVYGYHMNGHMTARVYSQSHPADLSPSET